MREGRKDFKNYVDLLISLSTGALVLGITFSNELIKNTELNWLLAMSWGFLTVSIISGIFVNRSLLDEGTFEGTEGSPENRKKWKKLQRDMAWEYRFQIGGFLFGILSLAIYAIISVLNIS